MAGMTSDEMLYNIMISVGGIQSDISQLKDDVAVMKTDVAELKTDVAELKARVTSLETDMAELKVRVTSLEADVAELKTGLVALNARITEMGLKLEQNILLRLDILQELHQEDSVLLRKAVYRIDDMEMKLDCVIIYINQGARMREMGKFEGKSM